MSRHRDENTPDILYGIHAVREAVFSRSIDHVLVREGAVSGRVREILSECRSRKIPVRFVPRAALDRLAGATHHQDVAAIASAKAYDDLDTLIRAQSTALLVVLDGVEDPANLGAIIRTTVAAGASGVVVAERRAAGLTSAVARAAAGVLEHARVARVKNLVRSLVELKERGIWVYGFEAKAPKSYLELDYNVPCALVIGGEGQGLHRLVREACDQCAAIPLQRPVESLNVSVAAGIVLYEALRQRSVE